jgi:hypothetical protein
MRLRYIESTFVNVNVPQYNNNMIITKVNIEMDDVTLKG